MKAFLQRNGGIIFLSIIFGLTIGLTVQSYQDLQKLKVAQIEMAYEESELMELAGDVSMLTSGTENFETLEYSPEYSSTDTLENVGPAFRFFQPSVGIGIVAKPVVTMSDAGEHVVIIRIAKIMCGSPANEAGFHVGDELVSFNGHTMEFSAEMSGVEKLVQLLNITLMSPVGTEVQVAIKRNIAPGIVFYVDVMSFTTITLPPLEEWKTDCALPSISMP